MPPAPATSCRARWTGCAPILAAAVPLLGTAFAGKLLGCAGLFMVLSGLGIHLGPATTLLVYTLTLMVALVGPLPGGIGIADASLGALLVANGVPGPSAAAAVVAFRLLDLWLPLLVGAAAGARQYRQNRTTAAATAAEAHTDTHLFDTRQPLLAGCRRRLTLAPQAAAGSGTTAGAPGSSRVRIHASTMAVATSSANPRCAYAQNW